MNYLVKVYVAGRRADITLEIVADSRVRAILLAKETLRKQYMITECALECYSCVEGKLN